MPGVQKRLENWTMSQLKEVEWSGGCILTWKAEKLRFLSFSQQHMFTVICQAARKFLCLIFFTCKTWLISNVNNRNFHQYWQMGSQKKYFKGTFNRDFMGKDSHGQGMELEFQAAAPSSTIACLEIRKTTSFSFTIHKIETTVPSFTL